jgi:hypothetical protein
MTRGPAHGLTDARFTTEGLEADLSSGLESLYSIEYNDPCWPERLAAVARLRKRGRDVKIEVNGLTACRVEADGEMLELDVIDGMGQPASLRVPFNHAQAIAMTLPRLLSEAVRRITGQQESRYVFPLGRWRVESAHDGSCAIATLATLDGFEVSFGIPPAVCRGLGWALKAEGDAEVRNDAGAADRPISIN